MRTLKLNVILLCLATLGLSAQQKVSKTKQTLEVNKDVTIDLNTSYVEIEVDTWNKGSVEIEAYLESDELNEAQLQEAAKKWNLDIDGAVDYVTIKSRGSKAVYYASSSGDYAVYLEDLEKQLANMPQMPEMPQVAAMPQMPEMPEMPEFPELPELPKGVKTIEFDVDAYKRDGQAYMDKWSAEYEEKYGKDFKKEMEVWAKKFADSDYQKKMEAWGEAYAEKFEGKWAEDMEKWGEEFGEEWAEKIEKWGEEFGKDFEKQIESWARRYEREMEREARNIERQVREMERREGRREDREKLYEEREKVREEAMKAREEAMKIREEARRGGRTIYAPKSDSKVKKVIKIKIPKKAKFKVNVRHGELTFASVIHNLNADVAYAPFKATEIDGGQTSINVSYAPVIIDTWKLGELNLNYVEEALLNSAVQISINSNSSNIELANLLGNAIIDGSFGDLDIINIAESFGNLNIVIENSDAHIALPRTAYKLQYKGNRSRFSHPEKASSNISSFSTGELSSGKSIVLNAKFSKVTMH